VVSLCYKPAKWYREDSLYLKKKLEHALDMKHVLKNLGKLFHHQKIILRKLKLTETKAED
jgi:hypothetical protein